MNETELERLVVRLLGDATSYMDMMSKARLEADKTAAHVVASGRKIEQFGKTMEGFAATTGRTFALLGVGAGVHQLLEMWNEVEDSQIRMEAVLQAHGREVEVMVARYERYADILSETTRLSRDKARELLTLAESFGMTGDQAERAARSANALGKYTRRGPESMMGIVSAFEEGDTKKAMAFARQVKELRGVKDEAELVAKYEMLLAAGTQMVAKEMDQADTKIDKAKQQMQQLGIQTGKLLEEAIGPLAEAALKGAKAIQEMDPATKAAVVQVIALTTGVIGLSVAVKMLWGLLASNPIGAIVASVFLLGRGLANLTGATKEYADAQQELNDKIAEGNRLLRLRLEANPNDEKAIQAHIAYLERLKEAEKQRVRDKPWLLQTVGESLDQQDALLELERQLKIWQERLEDARDRAAAEAEKDSADYVQKMLGKQFEDILKNIKEAIGKVGKDQDEYELSELLRKGFDPAKVLEGYRMLVEKRLAEETHKLQEALDKAGMSDINQKMTEWMRKGINGVHLFRLREMAEMAKLKDLAYQTVQGQRSPEERLKEQVGELTKALARGLLTWQQYGRAVEDARNKIYGAATGITPAIDATSNAYRVLAYEQMQKIRPALPDVNRPPLPMGPWPGAGLGPDFNMKNPGIQQAEQAAEAAKVAGQIVSIGAAVVASLDRLNKNLEKKNAQQNNAWGPINPFATADLP